MVSARRKYAQKVKSQDAKAHRLPGIGGDIASIRSPGTKGPGIWGMQILDEDRLFAATREPIGYRIVAGVASDMFDNWFTVNDPKTEGPDEELDRKIQDVLKQLNAKTTFIEAMTWARTYGWSLIAIQFEGTTQLGRERKEGSKILLLEVYNKTLVREADKDNDIDSPRFGETKIYELNRGNGQTTRINYSRVIRLPAGINETSPLDPVLDDLTYLRNIRWAMGQTMYRVGGGFPVIGVKNASDTELDSYDTLDLNARTHLAINPERVTIDFKGAQGVALNPTYYYNPIIENISAGSGIPSAILRGAQAGALTGSEVNEREYFKLISSLQSQVEPYVRQLIDMLIASGQIDFEGDYEIEWRPGFEPSELARNQAELAKEQANNIKLNYQTMNEVRAEEGLDPLPDGDIVPGMQRQASPFGNISQSTAGDQAEEHPSLVRLLHAIVDRAKAGQLDRSRAIAEAEKVIEDFGRIEDQRALVWIRHRSGRPDITVTPETQMKLQNMRTRHRADFEKILDDALKIEGG